MLVHTMQRSCTYFLRRHHVLATTTAALLSYPSLARYNITPNRSSYLSSAAFIHHTSSLNKRHEIQSKVVTLGLREGESSFASSLNTENNIFDWDEILPHEDHSHGSIKIAIPPYICYDKDPFNRTTFRQRLEATVVACRELNKSALWVSVPINRAGLIEDMVSLGVKFHNAEGEVANLCLWLKEKMDCKIPTFATHQVGVGALVINSRNEILCVRELRKNYMPWKIPTGLAELGEHLDDAAIREVYEETSIRTTFQSVLGVRHTHGSQFNRSDLFFVCRLKAFEDDDGSIPEPVAEEGEIESVAWVPLDEYKDMVDKSHPMMSHLIKLCDEANKGENDIQKTMVNSVVPGREPSPVYHAPIKMNNRRNDS